METKWLSGNKSAGIFFGIVALITIILSFSLYMDSRNKADASTLRIGVGDGIAGMMMSDVKSAAENTGLSIDVNVFADCCSNAAQWALNSGELDIGFYCVSIAGTLTSLNRDLEIYGPAVMNSEVVALAEGIEAPVTMAVPFLRHFISDLVLENYPTVTETLTAAPASVIYALSGGSADGAVLDIAQALRAPDFVFMPLSGEDYTSYSMVVRKDIVDTPQFAEFREAYNLVAYEYNDYGYLESRFGMSVSFWEMVGVRFLSI